MHGCPRPGSPVPPPGGELVELKELLRQQQEQLNQLTQTLASLRHPSFPRRQNPSFPSRPQHLGSLIGRRCHQPGHFASVCDGERVPFRHRANSTSGRPPSQVSTSHSSQQPGKLKPTEPPSHSSVGAFTGSRGGKVPKLMSHCPTCLDWWSHYSLFNRYRLHGIHCNGRFIFTPV